MAGSIQWSGSGGGSQPIGYVCSRGVGGWPRLNDARRSLSLKIGGGDLHRAYPSMPVEAVGNPSPDHGSTQPGRDRHEGNEWRGYE